MKTEKKLAEYVSDSKYSDLPRESVDVIRKVILTIIGTTLAGACAEGCDALINQVREWAGKKEATILVHGDKVPAHNAVLVNSFMARALDFCDAMSPGIHIGSSAVPVALASAELVGGCSGKDFLAAIVLGTEIAARINSVSDYDGFDPTGVCSIFAATAIAGKILRLNSQEMLHALALAFNRAGGSFQSNIDGSLAVRAIQGFVSQAGLTCAQLARRGITGPDNFLEGTYGYIHLYGKSRYQPQTVIRELGQRFETNKTIFKKYPSCGCTLAATDAILNLVKEKELTAENVESVEVRVSPYAYKLAGHEFELGDNPKVNAQFSIQYCVANALLRGSSKLPHFDELQVTDDKVLEIVRNVHVSADSSLGVPGARDNSTSTHLSVRMNVATKAGDVYHKDVDIPRGNPKNPLVDEEHMERFLDCVAYSDKRFSRSAIDKIVSQIGRLEEVEDVRNLIPLLISE
ncbi:MAG: 2-methylcitrate dehydratase [Syntrophorhabdaceae bacterium PtaU1.Bin034]|jgi:2-methylcitrate dehydratase PrpD|nr:MAG: 2-methylcitrate dehydratase [Syntrophorhabdaceae bacterium PtaU1.Bin034]